MAASVLAFHITDRCQLDCVHCLRDPEQKPKDLPLALIARILSQAKSLYKTSHVALTGGEPTQHPEIEGILDCIVHHECTYRLVTNGKRFDSFLRLLRASEARLSKLTNVNFSLDGADEATHDKIRGQGSFREVLTAVTLCTAYQIPFSLQMVCHAQNAHQIEALGLLASQLGAQHVAFAWHQPTGTHHDRALYLSAQAWRGLQDRIERLRAALTLSVQMPEGFYRPHPFHVCEPFTSRELHIDVEGNLNLCCQHSGVPSDGSRSDIAGHLGEMSLAKAHERLLEIIHQAQADRLRSLSQRAPDSEDEWDFFPCNACLRSFGKPYWQDENDAQRGGPSANRPRWRGAWAPSSPISSKDEPIQKKRLPLMD